MAPKRKKGGSLVIVGGGRLPPAIRNEFVGLAGGPAARVVVIPTASRDAGRVESLRTYSDWMPLARAGKVRSVVFLHTRRPAEANDPHFVRPLKRATAVWFSGGDQCLLTAAYKGTEVEREVRNVLSRGGVVGGTSAGAAVMSEVMIRDGERVAELGTGFGFLPGVVVDQHFSQRRRLPRLLGVLNLHPDYLGLGIDEQTGVLVQGHSVTVLGNNNVRVCYRLPNAVRSQVQVRVFTRGDRIDLDEIGRPSTAAAFAVKPPPGAHASKVVVGAKMN